MAEEHETCGSCRYYGFKEIGSDSKEYCYRHLIETAHQKKECPKFQVRGGDENYPDASYLGMVERAKDEKSEKEKLLKYENKKHRDIKITQYLIIGILLFTAYINYSGLNIQKETANISRSMSQIQKDMFLVEHGTSEFEVLFKTSLSGGGTIGGSINTTSIICNKKGSDAIIIWAFLGIDPSRNPEALHDIVDSNREPFQLNKNDCFTLKGSEDIYRDGNFTPFVEMSFFNGEEIDYLVAYSNEFVGFDYPSTFFGEHNDSLALEKALYVSNLSELEKLKEG